eukprot:g945.t1
MEAALTASRSGQHHVLTDFVVRYEGKELSFYSKSLGDSGAYAVAKGLQENETLHELNINENNIGPDGAKAIAKALEDNKSVIALRMAGNNIGPAGAKAIANMLKVNQTLRELNLRYNKIDDDGANAIGQALKVNGTLQHIDLRNNQLGDEAAKHIASALEVNTSLVTLKLYHNKIGDAGATAIAKALQINKTLTSLDLENNGIGDAGAQAMGEALRVNKSLKDLSLRNNDIGPEGAKAIAAALEMNTSLRELYMQDNNIGAEGARAFGEALKENKTLRRLDVSYNSIGIDGAKAIGNALEVNQSIERIYVQGDWIPVASFRDGKTTKMDLSGKGYDELSAIIIASLLMENKTVIELRMGANKIGPAGAEAIANMLKVNKSITTLNLNLNNIGPGGAAAIGKALEENKTLRQLDVSYNSIGVNGAKAIGNALENNTTLTKLVGIENKKALRIVETNRLRLTELEELCTRGAARVRVVGPADNTAIFEKGTNLQELVLQSSKITHQPSFQQLLLWIAKHRQLRRLRLNAIGLTDDDLTLLVSSEDGLTFLEELDLRANLLTTVPAEFGDAKRFSNLQKLLVSRNPELLKRDDELGRRARSDVNVLGVDAGTQVLQLLRLGSSKLKQIPRTRLQLVTVGNFKVGKSTLLERGWLAPSLKRKTAKWSRLERTTSVLLFNCLDSEAGLHWMVRDLPGQPEFYATNLHFLSADCAVFLLVCKATDDERTREQQMRLWLSALDSLGAYHRACCTVLVCTHQDQLEQPKLQRTQEWLQQLAPRLSSEFKHAHLDASGMLLDCETEKAPGMLEDLRKRVARAGRNLLSIPDLANVPEFLVMAQDGLAKWRNKNLTKWHASYAEALEIVKSLLPTSAPELVLRELIYQGDVMEFGTELVLSPVWLALALAVLVRPHEHPFYGLKTNRGAVSRQDIQKALLEERWPASMVPTLSEQEASEAAEDAAIDAKKKAKRASQADRRKSKMGKCEVCNKAWTLASIHHYCHECNRNVCSGCSESISRKRLCLHCRFGPKLAKEEDVPQVLRFLQVLDVIAPLSQKAEPLSAATPAPELTEDSPAPPPSLFRQPSFDISSAEQIMIPSSVGERYSGVIFAPRGLGFGFGERCLAAGVKFSQRTTSELVFPPGFMAVLAPRLLSKKLGPERSASYFGTHEFCFQEEDQPHTGDKGAVRVVLDEQGRELFLCVAGSKGFLCHYASSFVQEVLTVLRLPRWGRAEESTCVAHLLCQNCLLKGRGPARDTSQASNEICEVLDKQPWATGREGLSVLWGLSRHDDVRGQQAKAGKMGKPCWLDVEMEKRDEKAMEKGVQISKALIAIVTDDGKNSYFSREFCRKEVRWALAAGKVIIPVVSRDDHSKIAQFKAEAKSHGLDFSGLDFCTFDRSTPTLKQASVKGIAKRLAQSSVLAAASTSSPPAAARLPPPLPPLPPPPSPPPPRLPPPLPALLAHVPRLPPHPPASSPSTSLARPRALFPSSPPASSSSSSSSSPSSAAPSSAACGAFTPAGPSNAAVWGGSKCKNCQQPKRLHQ